MNNLVIVGRIVKDAELTYIANANGLAKLTFTVAVDRSYQKDKNNKKTDFIPCTIIGLRAEKLAPHATKGKQVAIQGELHIENVKKNDNWKTYVDVNVNIFEFLGGNTGNNKAEIKTPPGFEAILDSEIPF